MTATYQIINGLVQFKASPGNFEDEAVDLLIDADYINTPAAPVTFTQTYSTGDTTVANATYAAPNANGWTTLVTDTDIAAKTPSLTLTDADVSSLATMKVSVDQAQMDLGTAIATGSSNDAATREKVSFLATDVITIKKNLTSVIDALQAAGILA